jgi:hypothetical protein
MFVEVTLGGYTSGWEFAGSEKFQSWTKSRPWQGDGGICVIRTGEVGPIDELVHSVSKNIRGMNGTDRPVAIRLIECGGINGTPFQALLCALELAPTLSVFDARSYIRERLLDRPTVFILKESDLVPPSAWEEFVALIEHYRKQTVPICALIFDKSASVHVEPTCDFTIGRCLHHVLTNATTSPVDLVWSAYVHLRVYWESAGSMGRAIAIGEFIAGLSAGDDERLEELLQEFALLMSKHPSFPMLSRTILEVDAGGNIPANVIHELVEKGLMWRPAGTHSPRVVPWAARALLKTASLKGREVGNLRHSLVCSPLAAEILALCLQTEQFVRSRLHNRGNLERLSADSKASAAHTRFSSGAETAIVYPNAHPSPPSRAEDIWVFASLGELFGCCPSVAVSDLDREVLYLRNGIAHGHYVGWHQVKMALKQIRRSAALY